MLVFLMGLVLNSFASEVDRTKLSNNSEVVTANESVDSQSSAIVTDRTFFEKIVDKVKGNTDSKDKDPKIALILGLVSIIFFPFALHNWYLGNKKKALWQTLLIFPFGILILPAIVSWVWQLIDVIGLLIG